MGKRPEKKRDRKGTRSYRNGGPGVTARVARGQGHRCESPTSFGSCSNPDAGDLPRPDERERLVGRQPGAGMGWSSRLRRGRSLPALACWAAEHRRRGRLCRAGGAPDLRNRGPASGGRRLRASRLRRHASDPGWSSAPTIGVHQGAIRGMPFLFGIMASAQDNGDECWGPWGPHESAGKQFDVAAFRLPGRGVFWSRHDPPAWLRVDSARGPVSRSGAAGPAASGGIMADLVFIVSRTEPKRYLYLKHEFADESRDVVLDRRLGERRRSLRPPQFERRYVDRRHRDITRELQSSGWALVRRPVTYMGRPVTYAVGWWLSTRQSRRRADVVVGMRDEFRLFLNWSAASPHSPSRARSASLLVAAPLVTSEARHLAEGRRHEALGEPALEGTQRAAWEALMKASLDCR